MGGTACWRSGAWWLGSKLYGRLQVLRSAQVSPLPPVPQSCRVLLFHPHCLRHSGNHRKSSLQREAGALVAGESTQKDCGYETPNYLLLLVCKKVPLGSQTSDKQGGYPRQEEGGGQGDANISNTPRAPPFRNCLGQTPVHLDPCCCYSVYLSLTW